MGHEKVKAKLNTRLAIWGLVLAVLFIPPIFDTLLAIGDVNAYDKRWLVPISAFLFAMAIVWFALKNKIRKGFTYTYMVLLIILSLEVLTRVGVLVFGSDNDMKLLKERYAMTFDANMSIEGHPFVQYIGKKNEKNYNNLGYIGDEFKPWRPGNVIRIACLGESTMTDGLPDFIEKYLNNNRTELNVRYETMCFAHDKYTSAHSMITFMTTVLDFNPQYVLIHHGKSEAAIRNAPMGYFRSDYSHALKSWERSFIPDALLIRGSILYRHFRFVSHKTPYWWGFDSYIEKTRSEEYSKFQKPEELEPFRRNIENIIGIAKLRGIKVILTTLPHTANWELPHYNDVMGNIEQCNAITREIAEKHKDDVIFVDLDSKLSGSNHLYERIVEMTDEGREKKAELIGKTVLESSTDMVQQIAQLPAENSKEDLVEAYMILIDGDQNWRKDIQHKADEKGITYQEMLRLDAIHVYRQDSLRFAQ